MSPDLLILKRKVYGLLDLLGDIGGLASSLKSAFFALITVFQYKAAMSYVGNHTYLAEKEIGNETKNSIQKIGEENEEETAGKIGELEPDKEN